MYKRIVGATVAAALVTLMAPAANAVIISVSKNISGAVSFNDQTSLSDPTSYSGADLSVLFSFVGDTTTNTGVFSADVTNTSSVASDAIMTALGVNVVDNVFTETGFSFTPSSCGGACAFSSPGTGLSGFLEVDVSADADPPPTGHGLHVADSGLFQWTVSFASGAIDNVTDFFDVFESQLIDNTLLYDGSPGTDVNAFWIAHIQSVDTYDINDPTCTPGECDGSLKIGGAVATRIPEPGALALFGVGLIGLGFVARGRRLGL